MIPQYSRTVEPEVDPLSLEEARLQARITGQASDGSLAAYIKAATAIAEDALARGLLTQTWKAIYPRFYDVLPLPMAAPLQSVTSVKYYDPAGTLQTLSASIYLVDTDAQPGRVLRAPAQSWPATQADRRGVVEITYVVGWTAPEKIPARILQGLRMLVTAFDADRDGLDPMSEKARTIAAWFFTDRAPDLPPLDNLDDLDRPGGA
jgi:uncharacterized phiE125 gp8 family phage protein